MKPPSCRYGETYAQAIEVTGWRVKRLKNCKWVSSQVEKSLRNDFLSWTHHREVAALPPRRTGRHGAGHLGDHERRRRHEHDGFDRYQHGKWEIVQQVFPSIPYGTLREFERVAGAVKSANRLALLSWTHHQLVASLDNPDKQRQWLERAAS